MAETAYSIEQVFRGTAPPVRELYDRIILELSRLGPFTVEPRERSIHLVHSVPFAGVHPRRADLLLTLRMDGPVDDPRGERSEQVSANRWHVEIVLSDPIQVDDQLRGWLANAIDLV